MRDEIIDHIKKLVAQKEIRELSVAFASLQEKGACTEEAANKIFEKEGSVEYPTGNKGKGIAGIVATHEEVNKAFLSVLANVSNEKVEFINDSEATVQFHMEVLHKFQPQIAAQLPGNLLIVYDKVQADAVKLDEGWKFRNVKLIGCYKTLVSEME